MLGTGEYGNGQANQASGWPQTSIHCSVGSVATGKVQGAAGAPGGVPNPNSGLRHHGRLPGGDEVKPRG